MADGFDVGGGFELGFGGGGDLTGALQEFSNMAGGALQPAVAGQAQPSFDPGSGEGWGGGWGDALKSFLEMAGKVGSAGTGLGNIFRMFGGGGSQQTLGGMDPRMLWYLMQTLGRGPQEAAMRRRAAQDYRMQQQEQTSGFLTPASYAALEERALG